MTNTERIIDNLKQEKAELSKRIKKLIAKLDSRSLQFEDASLLEDQLNAMLDYNMILDQRIGRLEKENEACK